MAYTSNENITHFFKFYNGFLSNFGNKKNLPPISVFLRLGGRAVIRLVLLLLVGRRFRDRNQSAAGGKLVYGGVVEDESDFDRLIGRYPKVGQRH